MAKVEGQFIGGHCGLACIMLGCRELQECNNLKIIWAQSTCIRSHLGHLLYVFGPRGQKDPFFETPKP